MDIRFFAGAADAAGTDTLSIDASKMTVAQVLTQLASDNERLGRVFQVSSLLADGVLVTNTDLDASEITQLDVLPPFAGG